MKESPLCIKSSNLGKKSCCNYSLFGYISILSYISNFRFNFILRFLCILVDETVEEHKLPTPAKPSLKMRLFCDKSKRNLLCSVFENKIGTSSKVEESSNKEWLSKANVIKKPKLDRILLDSP